MSIADRLHFSHLYINDFHTSYPHISHLHTTQLLNKKLYNPNQSYQQT